MRTQKKAIIISLILIILSGIVALALELCCERFSIQHKDFIINLMLGIFASSLVTLVVAYLSYREIWFNSMNEYMLSENELFFKNAFLLRYLSDRMSGNDLEYKHCVSDEFLVMIQNIQLEIKKMHANARQMQVIKIPFVNRKKRTLTNDALYHYSIVSDYGIVISQIEKYVMLTRLDNKFWDKIKDDFAEQIKKMMNYLSDGENTMYSLHEILQKKYLSYYKIKE